MTKKQAAYHRYLNSEHWKQLRQQVLDRDGHRCVRCQGVPAVAHHRFYRKKFHHSVPEDLESLCVVCHEKEHQIKRNEDGMVVSIVQMPALKKIRKPVPIPHRKKLWLRKRKERIGQWLEKKRRLGWSC